MSKRVRVNSTTDLTLPNSLSYSPMYYANNELTQQRIILLNAAFE